jgi:hypothetical protein
MDYHLRDQRGERTLPPESNNALTPQSEMKALRNHFLAAGNRPAAWPHPSLCGEVGPAPAGPRRAQPDRYPDLGLGLASAFPSRLAEQWLVEVCSPLQWRNRLRFSRSSLSPDRVLDEPPGSSVSKNPGLVPPAGPRAKSNLPLAARCSRIPLPSTDQSLLSRSSSSPAHTTARDAG